MRSRPLRTLLLAVALVALPAPAAAQAARGLALGYFDHVYTEAAPQRSPWLARSVATGADIVRIDIGWAEITLPVAPRDARDPSDPAYDFTRADAAIVDATSSGLKVLVAFTRAPTWAEGPNRAPRAEAGSWKPQPAALEAYGMALGRRYSGSFPDPARPGQTLPRVEGFQVWNEPNLDEYISPQWVNRRTFAPAHYRRMINAFSRGVRSAGSTALVVSGGTAPYGDPFSFAEGHRIRPARFVREMLCLRTLRKRLLAKPCPDPARFDVLAHHPYSIGAPRRAADNADDVSISDLGKLTRLIRAAERYGRAPGRKRHPVWITEVSYDSKPPDPIAVPLARHARWLQESFYLLWKQGASTVVWFQVRDAGFDRDQSLNQSGTFFRNGAAKPAARAFRFPFVAERAGRQKLRVWGRAPRAGSVRIERLAGSRWIPVRSVRASSRGTFLVLISVRGRTRLRARVGGETSLTWLAR